MQIRARSWQEQACAKRLATSSKIPTRWQLEPEVLDDARSQRVIAGSYIERLLDKRTVQITSREGFEIVKDVADRVYTAEEVAGAFCKRAAFSQQLVIRIDLASRQHRLIHRRTTASMKSSLRTPSNGHVSWMPIMPRLERPLDHCMGCRFL